MFSHSFGSGYETVTGTYTVPNDVNAWFIQGSVDFADPTDYDVSYFSIKRTQTSDTTDDFRMSLSGHSYAAAGTLRRFETKDIPVNPVRSSPPTTRESSDSRLRSKGTIMEWLD